MKVGSERLEKKSEMGDKAEEAGEHLNAEAREKRMARWCDDSRQKPEMMMVFSRRIA